MSRYLDLATKYTIAGLMLVISFQADQSYGQRIPADHLKFFESKIRPVLIRECYSCHSDQAGQKKGGLLLDTKIRMEIGGDSGPAIVAGDLDESLLWNAINHEDYVMPPRKKLSDREIADFKTWIEMGAPDPRKSKVEKIQSTVSENDIKEGRKFWSFVKPKSPQLPEIEKPDWARTDIDYFIADQLEKEQLEPVGDTEANTLLRRLTIDITGLPPNPEQVAWFEKKYVENPDAAVERVVDRLLESPHFGERWGRHWLDVARYAESTGREVNATFPHAWRYRDYVINSFNEDKPYNEFVQEQIAGDLLPARTDDQWAEQLVATSFLAIGPKSLTEQNARQFNLDLVDEQIDVTSRVFLGISVACARCHDHKFDPIPQRDYYAMAGIFESTNTHYGTIDSAQNRRPSSHLILPVDEPGPNAISFTPEEISTLKEQLRESKDQLRGLQREQREARRKGDANAQRSFANLTRTATRIAAIESQLNSVDESGNALSFCMGVQDKPNPEDARLLVRGEFDQPTDYIERGFVQVITRKQPKIDSRSSGRVELAKWITDKRNPLTARVMVNRIWQHMFGQGIVRTPENFGATGLQPTHPELLDYLAIEFMDNKWSVKNMIRLIANSRTYRMSSQFNEYGYEQDPDNLFHWRANKRQLDAESLRDSMLFASGAIDKEKPHGSTVAEAGLTLVRDGRIASFRFGQTDSDSMMSMSRRSRSNRARNVKVYETDTYEEFRSVYLPIVRDSLPRALEVFDFAEPGMVVGKRESSNTPSQGLYLLNNEFVLKQSKIMAERLMKEADSTTSRIQLAFLRSYGRNATPQELEAAEQFYNTYETRKSIRNKNDSVELRKLTAIAHSILASAEFRYIN